MSENRKMILNMLKEGRITVEEADALLKGFEEKIHDGTQAFKEKFTKLEGVLKGVGNALETVASNISPIIEKRFDTFVQGIKINLSKQQILEKENITSETKIEHLFIDNEYGSVSISGSDRTDIDMEVEKLIAAKNEESAHERAKELTIGWVFEDGKIIFKMPELSNLPFNKDDINITLFVPQNVSINASTRSGDIKINGIKNQNASLELKTASGDIEMNSVYISRSVVESISGDINIDAFESGILLKSTSGDIDIDGNLKEKSKLYSISGNIRSKLLVDDTVDVSTTSGDIELALQPDNKGNIIVSSTSGDITFKAESFKQASLSNISGDIECTVKVKDDNSFEATTNSGDNIIKLLDGSNCSIAANTRTGTAKSQTKLDDLEQEDHYFKGKLGEGSGRISLQSSSGDIICKSF